MDCPTCDFTAGSPAGLASHRRAKHEDEFEGTNLAAVEQTLGELERAGRLEKIDSAQVQAVRSIATALDANPFNSQMWREYRESLEVLTADGDDDGTVEELLEELRSGAEPVSVRDETEA